MTPPDIPLYRGPGDPATPGRPSGIPLPPATMPGRRGLRMLKQWRYLAAFSDDLMLCAAAVRAGPVKQCFWAIWDRGEQQLREHTTSGTEVVQHMPGRLLVNDRDTGSRIGLQFEEQDGIEVLTPYPPGYAWTRKQGGVPVRGAVRLDRSVDLRNFEGFAIIDDWAGYPPRHVTWCWSAGVGESTDGQPVAWNLVEGVHDREEASERTVWVGGEPHEVGPVAFAEDLSGITFAEGGALDFTQEAVRSHRERKLIFRSAYEQPFGSFAGTLPGGITLTRALGVMERHDVVW